MHFVGTPQNIYVYKGNILAWQYLYKLVAHISLITTINNNRIISMEIFKFIISKNTTVDS